MSNVDKLDRYEQFFGNPPDYEYEDEQRICGNCEHLEGSYCVVEKRRKNYRDDACKHFVEY
jgi:hypothetical protein